MASQVLTDARRFVMVGPSSPFVKLADCEDPCCVAGDWIPGIPCVGSDLTGYVPVYFRADLVLGCNVVAVGRTPTSGAGDFICYKVKPGSPVPLPPGTNGVDYQKYEEEVPDNPTASCCGCVEGCTVTDTSVIPDVRNFDSTLPGYPFPDLGTLSCCCSNARSETYLLIQREEEYWDSYTWFGTIPPYICRCTGLVAWSEVRRWGTRIVNDAGVVVSSECFYQQCSGGISCLDDGDTDPGPPYWTGCAPFGPNCFTEAETCYAGPCAGLSTANGGQMAAFRSEVQGMGAVTAFDDNDYFPTRSETIQCHSYTGAASLEYPTQIDLYTQFPDPIVLAGRRSGRRKFINSGYMFANHTGQCTDACGPADEPPLIRMLRQTAVFPVLDFQMEALMDLDLEMP